MDAVNYSTFRENLKNYCDKVAEESCAYIITRKSMQPNVVLLSIDEYNELLKAKENDEYRKKIDRSFSQLRSGRGVKHDITED